MGDLDEFGDKSSPCSAALEAYGTVRTVSGPIKHAKSGSVGGGGLEPSDSLIGCVLLAH